MKKVFNFKAILMVFMMLLLLVSCDTPPDDNTETKYKLIYDAGIQESEILATEEHKAGEIVEIGRFSVANLGYDFGGWTDGKNIYQSGSELTMPSADLTLHAKWSVINYTITYNLDGGINNNDNPEKFTVESTIDLFDPSKDNYIFDGWYDNADFNGARIYNTMLLYDDITLYAKWVANQHSITIVKNNGEDNALITASPNDPITQPTIVKNGYTLVGWKDSSGNDFVFDKMPNNDLTVIAQWSINQYNIIYNLAGGMNPIDVENSYTVETNVILPTPIKASYTFMGWYDNAEFSGDKITEISIGTTGNKDLYAKFLKNIQLTFNTNGGTSTNVITPIDLLEGDTILLSKLPVVLKEDYTFNDWYLDEALTQVVEYGVTKFTDNTLLYAKFTETVYDSINVISQEETTLIGQTTNVSFTVTSSVGLTNENLNTYVTLTRGNERFNLPELTVSSLGDNKYLISPKTLYTAGANYTITVATPLKIDVTSGPTTSSVTTVYFLIKDEEKGKIEYQSFIIDIAPEDYYLCNGEIINLKIETVIDKNIHVGAIIAVESENTKEHYKIGNLVSKTFDDGTGYFEATLVECGLGEVYSSLDIYSGTMEDDSCIPSEAISSKENLKKSIESNKDFMMLRNYLVEAVSEYGFRHNYTNNSSIISSNEYDLDFKTYKTNQDPELYADVLHAEATFKAIVYVKLSDDVTATITIIASQKLLCSSTIQGYLYVDGFFVWDLDVDYDFEIYTIFRSETNFSVEVSLTKDGETREITGDLQDTINTADPNSVVAQYREYFNMNTSELQILTLQLCRFSFKIKIFEIGIPVELRVKVDINSIFKGEIEAVIQRGYSLGGTDEKGLDWKQHDHQQYYSLEFSSIGSIGLKVGVSIGIEVSFSGLSIVGRIGVEIELGAYFRYYGYGTHKITEIKINGVDLGASCKGKANYYYEFGIYLALNAYVRSDIFSFDYTKNFLYREFPLFDGGKQQVILGFVNDEAASIVVNSPTINMKNSDFLRLLVLDLKYGTTSIIAAKPEDLWLGGHNVYYDKTTGDFNILGGKSPLVRQEVTFTITYTGKHGNWKSGFLYKELHVIYLPPDLDIDPADANKILKIKFMLDGSVIHTVDVPIAKPLQSDDINAAFAAAVQKDPLITMVSWKDINEEVSVYGAFAEDMVFVPKNICYLEGAAFFTYLEAYVVDGRTYTSWTSKRVTAKVGTNAGDLVSQLDDFGHVDEKYYRFSKWDKEFEDLPLNSLYPEGRDLYYKAVYEEKAPFEVTIEIDPVYDVNNNMIQNTEKHYLTTKWMERLDYYYATYLHGYTFRLEDQSGNDPTLSGVSGPTVLHGWYEINSDFTIHVYDLNTVESKELMTFDGYSYGADASEILTNQTLIDLVNSLERTVQQDGWDVHYNFVGWAGTKYLNYMTSDVSIYPMFEMKIEYVYFDVKFDGGAGELNESILYQASKGFKVLRGESVSQIASQIVPTKEMDHDYEYTFAGWYDNPELNGEVVTDFTINGNITYYASYTQRARTFSLEVFSDGTIYNHSEQTTINILGQFEDDKDKISHANLSRSDWNALIESYRNDDTMPKPIAPDPLYEFSHWLVLDFGTRAELSPQYRFADGSVMLTFNIGQSSWQGITGEVNEVFDISGESSITLYANQFFEPLPYNVLDYLNGVEQQFDFSYQDDDYYYFPKQPMCWSEDGVNPIAEDTTYHIDVLSEDIELFALYESVPKRKSAEFRIDRTVGEKFVDTPDQYNVYLYGNYGTSLDKALMPVVIKEAISDIERYSIYHYVFDHWYCEETKSPEIHNFDDDYTYTPVFRKEVRLITLTLDATEKGVFQSTGTQTLTIETFAGVNFADLNVEKPIYTCAADMVYYNYFFESWDHVDNFTFDNNSTVTAYYEAVRNQNPAPFTGIKVTNGTFTEDIAENSIPGYEYDPINKVLKVTKAGLTFSGEANDNVSHAIVIRVETSEVTFKNLKFSNTAKEQELIRVVYYPRSDELLSRTTTIINIEGMVTLETNNAPAIMAESGAIIKGKGSNASLVVNATYEADAPTRNHIMWFSAEVDNVCGRLENLTVDINVTAEASTSIYGIYINDHVFEITNAKVTIDYVSGNSTNKYAIAADANQSTTDYDTLIPFITYSGCEWKMIEQF